MRLCLQSMRRPGLQDTFSQQKNQSISAKKERVQFFQIVLRCIRSGPAAGAATPVVWRPGSQTAAVYDHDHEILSELQLCRLRPCRLHPDHTLRFLPLGSEASPHEERKLPG